MPCRDGFAGGARVRVALRWTGAGPVFPMCDDQENKARACPGYVRGQTAGQGLSQRPDRCPVAGHRAVPARTSARRLRGNYLRMRRQAEAPQATRFTATPYSFTLKVKD